MTNLRIGFLKWCVVEWHIDTHHKKATGYLFSVLSELQRFIPGGRSWRNGSVGLQHVLNFEGFPYESCRYYLQRSGPDETVEAFPDGLRMLTGDPYVRNYTGTPESQAISWKWSVSFFLRLTSVL